jgi:ATP-dependent DNA ligase
VWASGQSRGLAVQLHSLAKGKAEFIEPTECALVSKLPEGPEWTFEVKLDGYRVIGVKTSSEALLYSSTNDIHTSPKLSAIFQLIQLSMVRS